MQSNMGGIDRVLRAVVGVGLIGWGVKSGNPWFYIGVIPLFTAACILVPGIPSVWSEYEKTVT